MMHFVYDDDGHVTGLAIGDEQIVSGRVSMGGGVPSPRFVSKRSRLIYVIAQETVLQRLKRWMVLNVVAKTVGHWLPKWGWAIISERIEVGNLVFVDDHGVYQQCPAPKVATPIGVALEDGKVLLKGYFYVGEGTAHRD